MGARARVVRLPHVDHYIPSGSVAEQIEQLTAEITCACRRRSGLSPEAFAECVQARSRRKPGLIGGAVRAAEEGVHPLAFDLVGVGMAVAGIDAVFVLSQMLASVS